MFTKQPNSEKYDLYVFLNSDVTEKNFILNTCNISAELYI